MATHDTVARDQVPPVPEPHLGRSGVSKGPLNTRAVGVTAERVRVFVKRHRLLERPAGWVSRVVASSPDSLPVRLLFGPLRARLRGSMKLHDVVRVLDALDASGVEYWLSGGWGVDALAGRQTRPHDDLDIVIDDFERDEPKARKALIDLGFEHVEFHERRTWMPHQSVLDDGAGHRVDFVSIDWDRLVERFGTPTTDGTAKSRDEALERKVLSEGTIEGRRVRCLSAEVQLLYHSGFALEPAPRRDVDLLRNELGAELPNAETP
jgi:lincosamide nucleotidyltransferase A/C/D/E